MSNNKNYTGRIVNSLRFLRKLDPDNTACTRWVFECMLCGVEVVTHAQTVNRGQLWSCKDRVCRYRSGDPKHSEIVFVGRKYGAVVVTDHQSGSRWIVACDNDHQYVSSKGSLIKLRDDPNSSGCAVCDGEKRKLLGVDEDEKTYTAFRRQYEKGARRRGIEFSLDLDTFRKVTSQPCEYCGRKYEEKILWNNASGRVVLQANGIDRIDSSIGYIESNIVPCCSICNFMKKDLSREEFLCQVAKIYERMTIQNGF